MGAARKLDNYDDYYDNEELNNEKIKKLHIPEQKPVTKNLSRKSVSKKKNRRRIALRLVLLSIIGGLLYANQVYQQRVALLNGEISTMDRSIQETKRDLMALETKNQAIKQDIDIVKEATNKLGLNYPTEDQIVYFQIDEKEEQDENTIFSRMYSRFTGKLD